MNQRFDIYNKEKRFFEQNVEKECELLSKDIARDIRNLELRFTSLNNKVLQQEVTVILSEKIFFNFDKNRIKNLPLQIYWEVLVINILNYLRKRCTQKLKYAKYFKMSNIIRELWLKLETQ